MAFGNILVMKNARSLAVDDILRQVHLKVMEDAQFTDRQKMFLIERMSSLEQRLVQGCTDKA